MGKVVGFSKWTEDSLIHQQMMVQKKGDKWRKMKKLVCREFVKISRKNVDQEWKIKISNKTFLFFFSNSLNYFIFLSKC